MKAAVYVGNGSTGEIEIREIEKPVPGEGQVLVKIFAVSLNALDYRSIQLRIVPKNGILGADIAGRVEAVGRNARLYKPGDMVFGDILHGGSGGFAEYATASETMLAPIPEGVSFEDACALPVAGNTALRGLRDTGCVRSGQKVLIHGSGGGVGTFAVQLAKYFGAHVTAVCGTANCERTRSLGADRAVDYTKEDITKNAEKFDLILAVNGYHSISAYGRMLTPKGIYVMAGGTMPQIIQAFVFGPLLSAGSKKFRTLAAKPNPEDLAFLAGLVKENRLKPVIDSSYPLDDAAEAMRRIRSGHIRGKVILEVLRE